jgi:glucose/arabinose dehydrogenase
VLSAVPAGWSLADTQDYQLLTLAEDLHWPWSVARLPDDSFLVTERRGRLLRVYPGGRRREVGGTPPTLFAGEGGYLDVVLDPGFRTNRVVYLSYAEGEERANGVSVFRGRLVDNRLEQGRRILRVAADKRTTRNYGGRLLAVGDDELLVTIGDGFLHRAAAQETGSELGKILRIDNTGQPAGILSADGKETLRIWALGYRNPQGLARSKDDGLVYAVDHGPRGGDELNLLRGGDNHGWPLVSTGVEESGAMVTPFRTMAGMEDPLWTWTPAIGPSGMAFYDGTAFAAWRGSFLVGGLVSRDVRRLRIVRQAVVQEEALFAELGKPIRDVRVFDGDIYLLTDGEQGTLVRVLPR